MLRFFNGIQIDVPKGWHDLSTVIVAPTNEDGTKPSINLVVKRRPIKNDGVDQTIRNYLAFMRKAFGELHDVQTKEMLVGKAKGHAVRFGAEAEGKSFVQTTLLYHVGGEEISATVTQMANDPTPLKVVEKLLQSIRPTQGVPGRL